MRVASLACLAGLALTGAMAERIQERGPVTYVIVPGMWSGGWDWRTVDSLLSAQGHRVYRVTLTGLGERVHLASPSVGLDTHVADVVNTIVWEELRDVVLVGHSYGGMVITGVADQLRDRIRRLVYVEAFVPDAGESVETLSGAGFKSLVAQNTTNGMIHPPWVPPDRAAPKEVPHPHRAFTDRLHLTNRVSHLIPASFILTVARDGDAKRDGFAPFAERARTRGWPVYSMEGDHTPSRSAPAELVRLLVAADEAVSPQRMTAKHNIDQVRRPHVE